MYPESQLAQIEVCMKEPEPEVRLQGGSENAMLL